MVLKISGYGLHGGSETHKCQTIRTPDKVYNPFYQDLKSLPKFTREEYFSVLTNSYFVPISVSQSYGATATKIVSILTAYTLQDFIPFLPHF